MTRSRKQKEEPSTSDVELTAEGELACHKKGCRCRRSRCVKKYCECFDAAVFCSAACRCDACLNQPTGGAAPGAAFGAPQQHPGPQVTRVVRTSSGPVTGTAGRAGSGGLASDAVLTASYPHHLGASAELHSYIAAAAAGHQPGLLGLGSADAGPTRGSVPPPQSHGSLGLPSLSGKAVLQLPYSLNGLDGFPGLDFVEGVAEAAAVAHVVAGTEAAAGAAAGPVGRGGVVGVIAPVEGAGPGPAAADAGRSSAGTEQGRGAAPLQQAASAFVSPAAVATAAAVAAADRGAAAAGQAETTGQQAAAAGSHPQGPETGAAGDKAEQAAADGAGAAAAAGAAGGEGTRDRVSRRSSSDPEDATAVPRQGTAAPAQCAGGATDPVPLMPASVPASAPPGAAELPPRPPAPLILPKLERTASGAAVAAVAAAAAAAAAAASATLLQPASSRRGSGSGSGGCDRARKTEDGSGGGASGSAGGGGATGAVGVAPGLLLPLDGALIGGRVLPSAADLLEDPARAEQLAARLGLEPGQQLAARKAAAILRTLLQMAASVAALAPAAVATPAGAAETDPWAAAAQRPAAAAAPAHPGRTHPPADGAVHAGPALLPLAAQPPLQGTLDHGAASEVLYVQASGGPPLRLAFPPPLQLPLGGAASVSPPALPPLSGVAPTAGPGPTPGVPLLHRACSGAGALRLGHGSYMFGATGKLVPGPEVSGHSGSRGLGLAPGPTGSAATAGTGSRRRAGSVGRGFHPDASPSQHGPCGSSGAAHPHGRHHHPQPLRRGSRVKRPNTLLADMEMLEGDDDEAGEQQADSVGLVERRLHLYHSRRHRSCSPAREDLPSPKRSRLAGRGGREEARAGGRGAGAGGGGFRSRAGSWRSGEASEEPDDGGWEEQDEEEERRGHELVRLHRLFGGRRAVTGLDLSRGMVQLAQEAIAEYAATAASGGGYGGCSGGGSSGSTSGGPRRQQAQEQEGRGAAQRTSPADGDAPEAAGVGAEAGAGGGAAGASRPAVTAAAAAALAAHVADACSLEGYGPAAAVLSVFGLQQMGPLAPEALAAWAGALAPGGVAVVVLWPSRVEDSGPWATFDQVVLEKAAADAGKPPPPPDAAAAAPPAEWELRLTEPLLRQAADGTVPGELLVDRLEAHGMEWESAEFFWKVMTEGGPWRARRLAQGDAAVDDLWRRFVSKYATEGRAGAGAGAGAAPSGSRGEGEEGDGAGGGGERLLGRRLVHRPAARVLVFRRRAEGEAGVAGGQAEVLDQSRAAAGPVGPLGGPPAAKSAL
ncbi:hypothetical protein GPECTOR_354g111 [Gonium pectorale]|uniref:CRC domain-containing protein n=1 Tax=Gonium pectorale TaxID=33097 RepID=A0A150FVK1_GONPE|nr:hypothetical protein GPECTOR_354g111 [Gonium pectorale]|eukprot:KXZ41629.1 hypothetical protein GPECTOR_354g111 [Gonium pectorale]